MGTGGASDEVEFELKRCRLDLTVIRILLNLDEEKEGFISEEEFLNLETEVFVVLTVGNIDRRKEIYGKYSLKSNVIFPNIILTDNIEPIHIGIGNVIMPGVRINCNVSIEDFNYINYGVFIAHDAIIGKLNTLSPFAVISGNCQIMNNNFLGTGVIVNPKSTLINSTISSGSVVRTGMYDSVIIAQEFGRIYEKR